MESAIPKMVLGHCSPALRRLATIIGGYVRRSIVPCPRHSNPSPSEPTVETVGYLIPSRIAGLMYSPVGHFRRRFRLRGM